MIQCTSYHCLFPLIAYQDQGVGHCVVYRGYNIVSSKLNIFKSVRMRHDFGFHVCVRCCNANRVQMHATLMAM